MLHFHIISLFPESIQPYLNASMLGRAQRAIKKHGSKPGRKALVKISYYNPRDFSNDPYKHVDRKPYGGGPGMVMEPESMLKAAAKAIKNKKGVKVLFFSPSGKQFDAAMARELASLAQEKPARTGRGPARSGGDIVFLCGHYEGIDARVAKILKATPVSVGPYVLTGGELPAATVIDAVVRQVPGVLGKYESLEEERTASPEVYTRPETLVWKKKKYKVPDVLLSGNHADIEAWKKDAQTRALKPDSANE